MIEPIKEKLLCTIALVSAKNVSNQEISILPEKSKLIDSMGNSYRDFGYACGAIAKMLNTAYRNCQVFGGDIPNGAKVTFLFLYPQLPLETRPVKLIVEAQVFEGWTRSLVETCEFEVERELVARKRGMPSVTLEEAEPEHVGEVMAWGKLKPELKKREYLLTWSQKQLRFLEISDQKLSDEIVAYAREVSSGYPFYDKRLQATIKNFWIKRHPYVLGSWVGSDVRSKKDEAESLAYQMILNDRKQYLDSLTEKLVQWALDKTIRRLTRADIKLFLVNQRITLPISAEDMLYREGKLKYRYLPPWKRK